MSRYLESSIILEYFRELGCRKIPTFSNGDAESFLRSRAMCSECRGLDNCKGHGFVVLFSLSNDKNSAHLTLDSCQKRKARDVQRKNEKLFIEATIPPGLRKCRLENYVTEGLGESVAHAKNLAISTASARNSLVLAGDVGTGKTHLAVGIVQNALEQGYDALFISAIGFLERLKTTFEKSQSGLYAEMIYHVKSVSCLAIDDLGAEKPSTWSISRIYDVLNTRLERNKQTIVTTNYSNAVTLLQRMEADPEGARRIISRLLSLGWITIVGKDYRIHDIHKY